MPNPHHHRSACVPEEMRSTIINFFRVPLNLFVCVVLYNVSVNGGWLGSAALGGWGRRLVRVLRS